MHDPRSLPTPTALVLDLDGTLVDTVPARIDSWVTALRDAGFETDPGEVAPLIGSDGRYVARQVALARGTELEPERAEDIDREAGRLFDELNRDPRPLPGAAALLETADARGIPWIIATSSRPEQVVVSVERLGLAHPPRVVDGSHVEHAKPEPDVFLRAAEELGLAPEGCWCIGDATWDMRAAVAAGMVPVGVTSGAATAEQLTEAGARAVVPTLDELVAVVASVAG